MLRAYARRECVHMSLFFLTWSIVVAVAPSLTSVNSLALAGVLAALGYLVLERVMRPHEPAICDRLGVIDVGYASVVRGWALASFGLAASLAIVVVVSETSRTILGHGLTVFTFAHKDWWVMLAALVLSGIFLVALGSEASIPSSSAWISAIASSLVSCG